MKGHEPALKSDVFDQGQLLGAASAVLIIYAEMNNFFADDKAPLCAALDHQCKELTRLVHNKVGLRNDIGDPIQLAGLIVFLLDGYVSTAIGKP